jgi:hypothetical protein
VTENSESVGFSWDLTDLRQSSGHYLEDLCTYSGDTVSITSIWQEERLGEGLLEFDGQMRLPMVLTGAQTDELTAPAHATRRP